MNMNPLRFFFPLVVLLSIPMSCAPSLEPLEAEVMAIHDEVMPFMGEMQQLRGQLNTGMQDLDSIDQIPYRTASEELKKGEDMMWDWMNQYKKPDLQSDTARTYLERQKTEIEQVSIQMKNAIQMAKQLIQ